MLTLSNEPRPTEKHRNSFRRAVIGPIALGIICTFPAIADHKSREQESPSQPVALVKFEVSAVDGQGQPVTDLQSSECQVAEDGKRETIALFGYDGNKRQAAASTEPQEYSNRGAFAARPTVILLDLLSERLLTWGQAGEELVQFLQRLESGSGLYFYVLTSRGTFYPVHALPRNEAGLRAEDPAWTQQIGAQFDVVSRDLEAFRPLDDRDPAWRAQLTLQSLGQFASNMAAIPGPKNLIWITHGVPSAVPGMSEDDMIDLTPQLRHLGEAFAQSSIAVHTVAQSASGAGAALGYSWETLQLISGLTGGRAYASDNVNAAITGALTDARGSYVVGYYPRRQQGDGKYHKLRITCARKGVRLQAKQGYWAFPTHVSPDEREHSAFEDAAVRPFDDSRIGLRVTTSPVKETPGTIQVHIRVDSADLMLPLQSGRYSGDLAVGLIAYSATGSVQNVSTARSPLSLTQEQLNHAAKNGIEIVRTVALDDATRNIRVAVFDRASNQTGSVTVPSPGH